MPRKYKISIADCIVAVLKKKGRQGATAPEIFEAVRKELDPAVPKSSVYSVLYARIPGAKSKFLPRFERFQYRDENKYRLLQISETSIRKAKHP